MPDPILTRFRSFLDASPSPLHAVATAAAALDERGFVELDLSSPRRALPAGTRGYVRRDGSLFAFRTGSAPAERAGFRIIAAHTDSPNLRIKPQPLLKSQGYVRLGVEPYGGVQLATWVDRDLGLAGAVHLRDGNGLTTRLVDIRRPLARVPTLAIHLNRGVNEDGLKLNAQTQLPAVFALEQADDGDPLRNLLSATLGCLPGDIVTWDLSLYDLTPAALGGVHEEFLFSARLDNLGSCHAGLEGLVGSLDQDVEATSVLALFDHEEIGSRSNRGADGRAIETVLGRLTSDLDAALARTWLLSADMAHAVHPAFADKHDGEHAPKLNAGPVIKLNTNQRYTSEGVTTGAFVLLCERAEVPYQWFVSRSDLGCGSTVGPMLAARLGVRSLDVGNPMLSMHSIREQCGAADHGHMAKVMARFLADPMPA